MREGRPEARAAPLSAGGAALPRSGCRRGQILGRGGLAELTGERRTVIVEEAWHQGRGVYGDVVAGALIREMTARVRADADDGADAPQTPRSSQIRSRRGIPSSTMPSG